MPEIRLFQRAVKELKWSPPEEFVVKTADGKTDLYEVLYKPYDFNPNKKYPVIENIYGCPQYIQVPRTFTDWWGIEPQALAQLGFVTFVVDARGTPGRGKVFQDVVYRNLGRFEVPDHVAALRQLAAKRPYMDLERVGITGGSCGGYFTVRALLLAPDVYRVGVAVATWDPQFANATEVWMGLPQDNKEAYEYASNLPLAGNLQGKLLLIHGTSDTAAPFSNIMGSRRRHAYASHEPGKRVAGTFVCRQIRCSPGGLHAQVSCAAPSNG